MVGTLRFAHPTNRDHLQRHLLVAALLADVFDASRALFRLDAVRRAAFAADTNMPVMIWGKILRSPHPHARIKAIDTSKAEKLPGVKAVVTARDIVDFPIEKGASLRMLPPVRFVQADEDVFRANCAKFTKDTGVEVKVDFVGWEDINQQTAVTSNSGAGPDIIIGFSDEPHIYVDKLIELTDVADYLGKRYGGWQALAQKYGKRNKSDAWIGLPFGATAGQRGPGAERIRHSYFTSRPDSDLRARPETSDQPDPACHDALVDVRDWLRFLLAGRPRRLWHPDGRVRRAARGEPGAGPRHARRYRRPGRERGGAFAGPLHAAVIGSSRFIAKR